MLLPRVNSRDGAERSECKQHNQVGGYPPSYQVREQFPYGPMYPSLGLTSGFILGEVANQPFTSSATGNSGIQSHLLTLV